MFAGNPREMVSVTPVIRNSIPSVVMKEGTLRRMVMSPIIRPIRAHAASASRIDKTTGMPARLAYPMMNGAKAKVWPTERSISREISSMISPQARITGEAMNCDSVSRLALVRKLALVAWK